MANFGCAVQHNLAAQIENPRDLVEPRALGTSDAMRRATVMNAYEKGTPTAAAKTADQSVAVSNVGH
jgi:pilus assembly protein CpaD